MDKESSLSSVWGLEMSSPSVQFDGQSSNPMDNNVTPHTNTNNYNYTTTTTAPNITGTATIITTGTENWEGLYDSTEDPDVTDPLELSLQLALPVAFPFLLGGLCFLYRYLYVTRDLRLARRPGDSDPPSTSDSSSQEQPQASSAGSANANGGITSGLAYTVGGVAGASFAPVCAGMGASIFAWQDEVRDMQYGCVASDGANYRNVFAQYCSAESFSNFEKTGGGGGGNMEGGVSSFGGSGGGKKEVV